MNHSRADFAVFGSTPLARLLAGLLARQYGKRVVIVADSQSGFRLPHAHDLSVGAVTRPQTWALLASTSAETGKLLTRIGGKAGISRIDPIFFAETPRGRQGLAYMRHVAAGTGYAVERLAPGALGPNREGLIVRDAMQVHRSRLEPALDAWLDQVGVERRAVADVSTVMQPDGNVQIISGGESVEAETAILADDAAIIDHLAAEQVASLFDIENRAVVVTEPTMALSAPMMMQVDQGLVLTQLASRSIVASSPGDVDALSLRLGVLLSGHQSLRRAGQSRAQVLVSRDRAPIVGRLEIAGPVMLAGLGASGVFLAPAIARLIAGDGRPEEAAYFAAHAPTRTLAPSEVAEYGPEPHTAESAA
jgi:hypothetical protein